MMIVILLPAILRLLVPCTGIVEFMISRRYLLLSTLAAGTTAGTTFAASGKMTLAMHQNTSAGAGYRKSLEGWARARIKNVEITSALLDEFLKTDTLDSAKHVLTDNGLTPVSSASGVAGLIEPNPGRASALADFKRRCEQFAKLGLSHTYITTATPPNAPKYTLEDYKTAAANLRDVAEAAQQFKMKAMVEFVRASTFIATLNTLSNVMRQAAHQNLGIVFDCYHFWSSNNKLEDIDRVHPGEIAHVHFQDVPDIPRELLDQTSRFIPGDGVSPLTTILRKLADKGYSGPLSVELFLPKFQQGDPYEVAREIRQKAETVMRQAKVL
jgi:2-keto-myo-inositol isomerase